MDPQATQHNPETRRAAHDSPKFPPLELVNRPSVPTEQAAYYLNRKPQTLREWAMTGKVIVPMRLNGRLAWPTASIRRALGVE
ncbi:MAG: hypothetical protein Q8M77_05265 [Hydrogenophaga sp.]|nr:hypothetical protein [Hydrogenophaga sp.]